MKKNIRTRVIGTVLAAVCALSATAAISSVSASAATVSTASVSAGVKAKNCIINFYGKTSYGYDWDYTADSTAAKIKVTYDELVDGELKHRKRDFTDWTAQMIQHMIDHCNGKLV